MGKKIHEFTAITQAGNADVYIVETDPFGTPLYKRIKSEDVAGREIAIPLFQVIPEGIVGYPDFHDLVTASAHVSGMVLPDGASTSTINFKAMHPIPDRLHDTPAARVEFAIMTKAAVAGPKDVRLTLSSLAIAGTENLDQAFAAETEQTVTMPTAIETIAVYSQTLTTNPVAGDFFLAKLKRDPTDAADNFTDDIQTIVATLFIRRG